MSEGEGAEFHVDEKEDSLFSQLSDFINLQNILMRTLTEFQDRPLFVFVILIVHRTMQCDDFSCKGLPLASTITLRYEKEQFVPSLLWHCASTSIRAWLDGGGGLLHGLRRIHLSREAGHVRFLALGRPSPLPGRRQRS